MSLYLHVSRKPSSRLFVPLCGRFSRQQIPAMRCSDLRKLTLFAFCTVLGCSIVVARVPDRHAQQLAAADPLADDPRPVWHRNFVANFNETTKLAFWSWHTNGKLTYSVDQLAERVDRDNGRGDRYCMSIHPFTNTPCTHLVVGGQRYLIFPELRECCRCCDDAGGCGVLSPDWLANAEYVGQVQMQGGLADEWSIRGLQPNNYFATADTAAVPLQLDQLPNDYITFDKKSFDKGSVAPSAFDLPDFICANRTATKCARRNPIVRLRADKPQLEEWLHNMLNIQFFTPCQAHKEHKKNEATYFCADCGASSRALCAHCLPQHAGHRMIQIRRYVYCDVVRASDMSAHVDVSGVQTYIINQAKVMFLNQRPQSKMGRPGAPDSCLTCARTLREGCSYCSLACKIEALQAMGRLRMPTAGNGAEATLSESSSEGWPIQPNSYRKLYESEVNSLALQVQDGASGDSSSSQQLWGEHRQHVHVGAAAAWLRRNSDDSTSSGSYCSRRKQFSPRRSPLL